MLDTARASTGRGSGPGSSDMAGDLESEAGGPPGPPPERATPAGADVRVGDAAAGVEPPGVTPGLGGPVGFAVGTGFAVEVLGTAASHGSAVSVHYPGKVSAFAIRLRYEPFDPDNPDFKSLGDLTRDLNSYASSFAKATVEYQTINPRDRADGPENEAGTHLTYRMLFDVEACQITPQGWTWVDQPSVPAPSDAFNGEVYLGPWS